MHLPETKFHDTRPSTAREAPRYADPWEEAAVNRRQCASTAADDVPSGLTPRSTPDMFQRGFSHQSCRLSPRCTRSSPLLSASSVPITVDPQSDAPGLLILPAERTARQIRDAVEQRNAVSLFGLFTRRTKSRANISIPNALSGYFEIRSGNMVGWVRDIHGDTTTNVRIDVIGDAGPMMTCEAKWEAEHKRFTFIIPIEGRFSNADLIKEKIVVLARDGDGNSGRVLLDGIAQLALIREHLGVPATKIFDLDFSEVGNARPYLKKGWANQEADWIWTEGPESTISVPTPTEVGNYLLRMSAGSFVHSPRLLEQELTIFVSDTEIGRLVATHRRVALYEFTFSHAAFPSSTTTTLLLRTPNATRPIDLGINEDRRRLAFGLKRMTILRLLGEKPNAE